MLAIELQFPGGRYHANPWGRNVNEGEVEWPPSPYRLARALIDVWKRRRPDWPEEKVLPIIKALAKPPSYYLPPAVAAHTRSFLSTNEKDPSAKQLIFDAFVVVDRDEKTIIGFDSDLEADEAADLEELLDELNYLGRSESWVRAQVARQVNENDWNCLPANHSSETSGGESVQVACLLSAVDYEGSSSRPESYSWLRSLCMDTKELLADGWSSPPVLAWVDYKRKENALQPSSVRIIPSRRSRYRVAKYALYSTVLPQVQSTVSFAERIRSHLMGIHKKVVGDDPTKVSRMFSGKNPDGKPLNGHRHAFFLPLDEDGDGRIDHLLVTSAEPFGESELSALDRLRSVWQPDRRPDVEFVLTSLMEEPPVQDKNKWISVTPFVTARHYRKGRGSFDEWLDKEIEKECLFHNLPVPKTIRWIPYADKYNRPIRWLEFMRSRKNFPVRRGYGCIIEFDQPVSGPFSLGSGCHFGLGLFMPFGKG